KILRTEKVNVYYAHVPKWIKGKKYEDVKMLANKDFTEVDDEWKVQLKSKGNINGEDKLVLQAYAKAPNTGKGKEVHLSYTVVPRTKFIPPKGDIGGSDSVASDYQLFDEGVRHGKKDFNTCAAEAR
ncbi:hypothetical protein MTO96_050336, partial [Rhipicephalus appendiculatus]